MSSSKPTKPEGLRPQDNFGPWAFISIMGLCECVCVEGTSFADPLTPTQTFSVEGCGSSSRQPSAQFKYYEPAAAVAPHIVPHCLITLPPQVLHTHTHTPMMKINAQGLQSYPAGVGFLAGHRS